MNRMLFLLLLLIAALAGCGGKNQNPNALESPEPFLVPLQSAVLEDSVLPPEKSRFFCLVVLNPANGKRYILNQEQAEKRASPASTFKIPLALMGFDSEILMDAENPVWNYKEGYQLTYESWKKAHTPASWMKNSVVWYSQEMTIQLGMKNFRKYLELFNYGNLDTSGNPGRGTYLISGAHYVSFAGLLNSWLGSSLKISPLEQIDFLMKLKERKLPVSIRAMQLTEQIINRGTLKDFAEFFGKTGTAQYALAGKNQIRLLWYVGWFVKGGKYYIFASNRYVNVPAEDPFYPFADSVSAYLQKHFLEFKLD